MSRFLIVLAFVLVVCAPMVGAQAIPVRPVLPVTPLATCGVAPTNNNANSVNTYQMCINTYNATRLQEISKQLPNLSDQFQITFYFMQVICVVLGLIAGMLAGDF